MTDEHLLPVVMDRRHEPVRVALDVKHRVDSHDIRAIEAGSHVGQVSPLRVLGNP